MLLIWGEICREPEYPMSARNTLQQFGWVTRLFHWLTALLILTAFPLGLYANDLPFDTSEALAWKAQVFSLHKTLGVMAFLVAVARILWALGSPHPVPLHPERRAELFLANLVHWLLYLSMLAVPLTGWIHHAAVTGFAPILWPFGQDLPFIPKSEGLAATAAGLHWLFTKLLGVAILLHILGALKHHLIDRDATLRRMTRGEIAPRSIVVPQGSVLPAVAAVAIYALAAGATLLRPAEETATAPAAASPVATAPAPATTVESDLPLWQVREGTLGLRVLQMGQEISGGFAGWTAEIHFDPDRAEAPLGQVRVTIDTASLTLGSVSDQAKGNDFFNVAAFPQAVFDATIVADGGNYAAEGTLSLRGTEVPVSLPFTLTREGDSARMQGEVTLDRRSFGMGAAYPDESSVGFSVRVLVELTADRQG